MLQLPRWQNWTIIGVTLVSILLSLPNIIPAAIGRYLPDWYAGGVVNLGLDLRGGVHLVFDVDMRGVVRQRMSDIADSLRPEFRKAQVTPRDIVSEAASVTVTLRDAADAPKAVAAIRNVEGGILLVTTVTPTTLRIEYPPAELARRKQQILDQSIEVVRKRIDSTGTKEPTIQRQGDERILVQVPGIEDPDALIRIVSTTAQMRFHLLDESVPPGAATTPPTVMWRPDADRPGPREAWERFIVDPEIVKRKLEPKDKAEAFCRAQPLNCLPVRKRVVVGGEDLTDAQGTFDPQNSRPIVRFSFTPTGGRAFCRVTTDNVGVRLAILLDEAVISAPNIQQPICGGSGIITGQFTPESTSALALQLRSGALPAT
ncbi:MAG: hypothetical protein JNL07_00530, partial [Rhodospirillales bacterium]|nr:hypothetical protein [Rhodospirillales bacterium]